jgi:hypothetical protein
MLAQSRFCILALLLTSATACGLPPESQSTVGVSPVPGNNSASGTVLSGRALQEHGGTLLGFLRGRLSNVVVDYSTSPCPSVQIRGRKSIFGSNDPVVYVDGGRAVNTCALDMMLTRDVNRVEVYPMGVSNRPGYQAHPNGLILVFMHDGPIGRAEGNHRVGLSDAE